MNFSASQPESPKLRVGTRGSALALHQANLVRDRLRAAHPGLACELVPIVTQGDRDKTSSLTVIGGQGVFAKELQRAVLAGDIDCGVHSLKDVPSELPAGLRIGAVLAREDPRDVLISRSGLLLDQLPSGASVGTSSRRRMAQLRAVRPDISAVELRGNIDTRLRKALNDEDERYDAIILAAAGVTRMGWAASITEYLDLDRFTPAPGQAALAVDCRLGDQRTQAMLDAINDAGEANCVTVERAFLGAIGGGCRAPVGAHAVLEHGQVRLRVTLASEDLAAIERANLLLPLEQAEAAAARLADELMRRVGASGVT